MFRLQGFRVLQPPALSTQTPSIFKFPDHLGYLDFSTDLRPRSITPPHNESVEERERRFSEERAAKQVSDRIDEQINKDRQQRKKEGNPVKILLLGQSESGKSTTLKTVDD
ncbi:hypothetical protein C8J57DRAFT_1665540 [Mycena rebaudengoi]|nr:hypothetical protein C8J57DRAFT_1665540 [Mycena rebaudengoi]